jgi:hypothetical protein
MKTEVQNVGGGDFIRCRDRKYSANQSNEQRIKWAPYSIDEPVPIPAGQHSITHIKVGNGVRGDLKAVHPRLGSGEQDSESPESQARAVVIVAPGIGTGFNS